MIFSALQSVSSLSTSESSAESNIPFLHGVDWSEQAQPISHCWFPYNPTDPSSSLACSFFSCKNPKPTLILSLVQCESCLIVVHTHHLTNLQPTNLINFIPSCRPSFSNLNENDQVNNKFDRHFWSNVSILSKPCAFCKRKSLSSSLFGNTRPSTMPTLNMINNNTNNNIKSPIPGSPQLSGPSSGFLCLWCSRGYHRRCWEQAFNHDEKNKCDYGVYR